MDRKYLSQVTLFIVASEAVLFCLFSQDASFVEENGLIENLQVLVLFLGGLASLSAAFLLKRDAKEGNFSRKVIGYGFAILALSFIVRELDFRGVEGFDLIVPWTSSPGSRWLTLFFWMPFFIYIGFNRSSFKRVVLQYWRSEHFWRMSIVVCVLIFSDLVENGVVPLMPTQFFEESLELVAYLLFSWNLLKIKGIKLNNHGGVNE